MNYRSELSQMNYKNNVQMRIAAHCAQVLAGVKPSNSVTLGREDTTVFIQALTGTGIQRRLIYDGVKRCVWLLYRENELEHYLMIREHQEFMKSCGIPFG